MNIHPIFVHFPIALLMIYSILELIRLNIALRQPSWFYIKAAFVIIGAAASYITLLTGSLAENLVQDKSLRPLIDLHSSFAVATVAIYSVLAAAYLVSWIRNSFQVWPWLTKIQVWIIETKLVFVLAIAGFIALFITGALGGSIVYGPSGDPITNFVYHLFF